MPLNVRGPPNRPKRYYNKWRLAILACNNLGLVLFLFGLGVPGLAAVFFVPAIIILWAGAALAYTYYRNNQGKAVEIAARFNWFISLIEAVLLSVLAVITLKG